MSKQKEPTFFRPEALAYRYRARWGYIRREKIPNGVLCAAAVLLACILLLLIFKVFLPEFKLGLQ